MEVGSWNGEGYAKAGPGNARTIHFSFCACALQASCAAGAMTPTKRSTSRPSLPPTRPPTPPPPPTPPTLTNRLRPPPHPHPHPHHPHPHSLHLHPLRGSHTPPRPRSANRPPHYITPFPGLAHLPRLVRFQWTSKPENENPAHCFQSTHTTREIQML